MTDAGVTKRVFDVAVAGTMLVLTAPLLAFTAWLVRADVGRPILFRQIRPGLNGRPFVMVKFRTMRDLRDSSGQLLSNDARLTRIGRFLRSTSLDELPELWNVLRGDMSLVGPEAAVDGVSASLYANSVSPPRGQTRIDRLGSG